MTCTANKMLLRPTHLANRMQNWVKYLRDEERQSRTTGMCCCRCDVISVT